jgi:hypothetical protein
VRTAEEIAEHNKPLELLQESKRRPMKWVILKTNST